MAERMHDAHHIERIKKKREAARRRKKHTEDERKKKEKQKDKETKQKEAHPKLEKKGSRLTKNESMAVIKMKEQALSPESEKLQNKIYTLLDSEARRTRKKVACVQFFVNRIFSISDEEETVEFDMYLKVNWIDPKWKNRSDVEFQADEKRFEGLWKPGVEVTNKKEMQKLISEKEAYWVEFPKYGILAYTQRLIGGAVMPIHLHEFPFDNQVIPITFESFHWKAEDLHLVRLAEQSFQLPPRKGSTEQWLTMSDQVKLTEWNITGISVRETLKHYPFEDRTYSQIRVEIGIERSYGYYLLKVLVLLVLLVMQSWVVFVFEANEIEGRSVTTVTLFLAAVAFNFIISATLPKVSYQTKMDIYLLVCYAFIFLSIVETGIVYAVDRYLENPTVAFEIDKWCLVAFPAAFFLYTLFFCLYVLKKLWNRTFKSSQMQVQAPVTSQERAKQFIAMNEENIGAEGTVDQPQDTSVGISVIEHLPQELVIVVK